jgi:hypothetical protein
MGLGWIRLEHDMDTWPVLVKTMMKVWVPYLTNSMQQRPSWEANSFSASQEIPRILWNPNLQEDPCLAEELSAS